MHHFLVHGSAKRKRITPVSFECRLGAFFPGNLFGTPVKVQCFYPRPDNLRNSVKYLGNNSIAALIFSISSGDFKMIIPLSSVAPSTSSLMRLSRSLGHVSGNPALFHESFILPGQQMGFDLPGRIKSNTHYNQQRGAAEIKGHIEIADQYARQHAYSRNINRTAECQSRQHIIDIFGRFLPRPNARNITAVFFHVIGHIDRVESHSRIEITEENNKSHIQRLIQKIAPASDSRPQLSSTDAGQNWRSSPGT